MRALIASSLIFAGLAADIDAAHAQSEILVTPAQVASAAKDCIASFENHRFKKDRLNKRGWRPVKLSAMGGLEGIMQGWIRNDGVLMFTLQTGCIVKVRMTPEARADVAAFDREFGSTSQLQPPEKQVWHVDEFKLELTPGPTNGSNVNLSVIWFFEPASETSTAPNP